MLMIQRIIVARLLLLCGILCGVATMQASQVTVQNLTPYPVWVCLVRTKGHTKLYLNAQQKYEQLNQVDPAQPPTLVAVEPGEIVLILLAPGKSATLPNFDFQAKNLAGVHRDVFFSRSEKELAAALMNNTLKTSKATGYINVGSTKSQVFIGINKKSLSLKGYTSQKEAIDSGPFTLEQVMQYGQNFTVGKPQSALDIWNNGDATFRELNKQVQDIAAATKQNAAPTGWPFKSYLSFEQAIQILGLNRDTMLKKGSEAYGALLAVDDRSLSRLSGDIQKDRAYAVLYLWLNPYGIKVRPIATFLKQLAVGTETEADVRKQAIEAASKGLDALYRWVSTRINDTTGHTKWIPVRHGAGESLTSPALVFYKYLAAYLFIDTALLSRLYKQG